MFVLTISPSDYLDEVKCFNNLADAQDEMIRIAIEEAETCNLSGKFVDGIHDYDALENFILNEAGGSIDAMFCDFGGMSELVLQIWDVEVH